MAAFLKKSNFSDNFEQPVNRANTGNGKYDFTENKNRKMKRPNEQNEPNTFIKYTKISIRNMRLKLGKY